MSIRAKKICFSPPTKQIGLYVNTSVCVPGPGALGRVAGPEPHGSATAGAEPDPQGSLFFMGEPDAAEAGRPQGSTGAAGLVALPAHTQIHNSCHLASYRMTQKRETLH